MVVRQEPEVVVKEMWFKMVKNIFSLIFFLVLSQNGFAQKTMSELLTKFNDETIPYMSVEELMKEDQIIIMDAREKHEYDVSHLKNAIYVGYDSFDLEIIENKHQDKDVKIVIYCSLGIRSEDIAEQLKAANYTNVYNLYGGIFEWKNTGNAVYDNSNEETEKVHVSSELWGKWLLKGEKVHE